VGGEEKENGGKNGSRSEQGDKGGGGVFMGGLGGGVVGSTGAGGGVGNAGELTLERITKEKGEQSWGGKNGGMCV